MIELYTEKYGATTSENRMHYLANQEDIPHTVIYGSEGSGKLSLINTWLRERFGVEITKLRRKTWECNLPSKSKPVEVELMSSSVHHVLDPTNWGQQDRNVLSKFIKDTCLAGNVSQFLQRSRQKIVVLRNTEILTENAQKTLRYLLDELQTPVCSVVMLTNALFKLQPALVSRCRIVKTESTCLDIERHLHEICRKEGISTPDRCGKIAEESKGNWRYALNTLQMITLDKNDHPSIKQSATRKLLCNLDAKRVVCDEVVTNIRKDAYTCLTCCGVHHPGVVLKNCIKELVNFSRSKQEDQLHTLMKMAWEVDMLMCRGTRPVMHIELFIMQLWDSGIADAYVNHHREFTAD